MTVRLSLQVNGAPREAECADATLLVDLVRDTLDLPGTRIGCLTGDCGACTVVRDGALIKSCLTLAASADGCDLVTIEGADSSVMRALRQAFIDLHGFQCGYCTAGMLLVAEDLLARNPAPAAAEIRDAIAGNICRCTGYDDIVAAIAAAAERLRGEHEHGQ
jgi:carbon-monoxide dehydrogenase small subunit